MYAIMSVLVASVAIFELQYYTRHNKFKDVSGYIIAGILMVLLGLTVAGGLYTIM